MDQVDYFIGREQKKLDGWTKELKELTWEINTGIKTRTRKLN